MSPRFRLGSGCFTVGVALVAMPLFIIMLDDKGMFFMAWMTMILAGMTAIRAWFEIGTPTPATPVTAVSQVDLVQEDTQEDIILPEKPLVESTKQCPPHVWDPEDKTQYRCILCSYKAGA